MTRNDEGDMRDRCQENELTKVKKDKDSGDRISFGEHVAKLGYCFRNHEFRCCMFVCTPENEQLEAKNHPFAKESHLRSLHYCVPRVPCLYCNLHPLGINFGARPT